MSRAIQTYQAMTHYFYQPTSNLYSETFPIGEGNPFSYVWPYSQVLNATLDMRLLPKTGAKYSGDIESRLAGLQNYWNEEKSPAGYDSYVDPPLGNGGDIFYDDNEWIGIDFIQHYDMTGDPQSLKKAKQIFELVVSGWDDHPDHPAPGGVFWTQASWSRDRNTISNAPAVKIGLHLYQITKNPYYLKWSKKMYHWVNKNMLAPNGLYWDHIDLNGNIDKTQWSYNQGVMIGANILFYQTTHEKIYLKRAEDLADKSMAYYKQEDRLNSQSAVFNAIYFRNLLKLSTFNHNQKYIKMINEYAQSTWDANRNQETNLFTFNSDQSELLQQAGMVEIYALLSLKKQDYPLLP
nr:glycoside hydrolase family 76 protein [Pullulanibacillus pueri]